MYNLKVIKYFAYCRKSSEDSSRQIASIGDQITSATAQCEQDGIKLAHRPFTEERSAKEPGRPLFNEMLDRIGKGEANGIVCWDIDRLYRNPIDEGRLRWMLQTSVIQIIKTPSRDYYPEDAGLLMGVEGGRATDFVIRLSKNVKRGLKSKVEKGWRPGLSPIGYMNIGEEGNKTIIPDPDNFPLVRKMWDLFLSGSYSVSKIRDMATDEWGLRTKIRRKIGGQPLTMSHMYNIFRNPFYYGFFEYGNSETGQKNLYKGMHEAMITEQEYNRAQLLLGKHGKPHPQTREFAFTGTMRCGECDSMITAEAKNQIICTHCKHKFAYENKTTCSHCDTDISQMEKPTILNYVYYHCTKKKNRNCRQGSIRREELERQFNEKLGEVTIDNAYLNIAIEYLRNEQQSTVGNVKAISNSLQGAYENCQQRIDNLQNAYISPQNSDLTLYTAEDFKTIKAKLLVEREGIKQKLNGAEQQIDKSYEITERVFNFCTYAKAHFNDKDASLQTKRTIFSSIGSNLIVKDKKLSIGLLEPYFLINRELTAQKNLSIRLEPKNKKANSSKITPHDINLTSLLRR